MTASSRTSAITVVPLSARDTKAFIALPQSVYQNDPCWIPPLKLERKEFLNRRKNPFFQEADGQLFLALHGRQPVGRIAAVINHLHDRQHHERAGFFGLFECLPQAEAAATALFHAATEWVRERGATFIRGPLNLSTNELACGLLVEGFDTPPVFDSAYNPPYYAEYIESNGFTACKDLLAFIKHYAPLPERVAQAITRLRARGTVTVRPINMRDFTAEVARIAALYNEAWSENWGFVPITEAGAQHLAKHLKLAVIPELTLIAEVNREPVGCFVAIPDMNQALRHLHGRLTPWGLLRFFYHRRRIDTVRVAMVGVKKRYRRLGVNILLLAHVWEQAPPLGYIHGELAWILEDNELMIRAIEEIGAKPYKRYRLYQKDVV